MCLGIAFLLSGILLDDIINRLALLRDGKLDKRLKFYAYSAVSFFDIKFLSWFWFKFVFETLAKNSESDANLKKSNRNLVRNMKAKEFPVFWHLIISGVQAYLLLDRCL